jgi:SnoaL-like polyketide cyclase
MRSAGRVTVRDSVIDQYYSYFNERRFVEATALFAETAVLEQLPLQRQERGGIGYLQFVSAWLRAFPDAALAAQHISSPDATTYEVDLAATGTHRGALEVGGWVFRPTGAHVVFRLRELLQVREGKIAFSSLSFDLHEIIDKLARVDASRLLEHIERLHQLGEDLKAARNGAGGTREIADRIGQELDAARHVVRPYYKR